MYVRTFAREHLVAITMALDRAADTPPSTQSSVNPNPLPQSRGTDTVFNLSFY